MGTSRDIWPCSWGLNQLKDIGRVTRSAQLQIWSKMASHCSVGFNLCLKVWMGPMTRDWEVGNDPQNKTWEVGDGQKGFGR